MNKVTVVKPDVVIPLELIEGELLQYSQVVCPVVHRFSPGLYTREVKIPAGTLALGHYQKTEQLNIFVQGKVRMLNMDGSYNDLVAPMVFTAPPGRKLGYIIEDVIWLNVYSTDETDIETLENIYIDKSKTWLAFTELQERLENGKYQINKGL